MKPILTAFIMSCALMTAHAGDHYIYGQYGRTFYTSGRYLYDSQTGESVGYFENGYLYSSSTGETVGYLSGHAIYSTKTGELLGYCDPKD